MALRTWQGEKKEEESALNTNSRASTLMIKELRKKKKGKVLPKCIFICSVIPKQDEERKISDLESDGNLLPSLKCVADSESHESVKSCFSLP